MAPPTAHHSRNEDQEPGKGTRTVTLSSLLSDVQKNRDLEPGSAASAVKGTPAVSSEEVRLKARKTHVEQ